MPIFFQQDIDRHTRLAIWKIEEKEDFFLKTVPLQSEITHPHKRLQHLAGRFLLKHLFADFPLELILIADTRKPYLEDEAFHFSISHCGDYAAVIVSRERRVGIDIEIPKEKVVRILDKFLHEEEFTLLLYPQNEQNNYIPTLLWSAKESMFKWWGKGKVDFSEMLRLSGHAGNGEGFLEGKFISDGINTDFPVRYKNFGVIVMAYVCT